MLTAIIKLTDIAARSLFALIILYSLPPASSGLFGLILTLVGLCGFLCGFERYIDLQRMMIGKSTSEVDSLIFSTLRFFGVNYVLWLPILAALLHIWLQLSPLAIFLCLLITVGEHLGNELYRIVLVTHRHRNMLLVSMFKNLLLLGVTTYFLFAKGKHYALDEILMLWAALSFIALAFSIVMFTNDLLALRKSEHIATPISDQFKRSLLHFLLGLLALLSLQADRLIAGNVLTLDYVGIYFKNLLLVTSIYQFLSVISYNRVMPVVYRQVRIGKIKETKKIINRQLIVNSLIIFLAGCAAVVVHFVMPAEILKQQHINAGYLLVLLFAYLIRCAADYNAMILNALFLERRIFQSQLITLGLCVPLSICLGLSFSLFGLILSPLFAAIIYMVITKIFAVKAIKLANEF